ncbi:hypothetical protein OSTOST_17686, partial [Ostertagia ostertagi]
MSDFASLRRGSLAMHVLKLQAVPPLPTPSQFTYTHHNGNTMLAKTQGTSMSPPPEKECQTSSAVTSEVGVAVQPSVADLEMQTDEQITPKTNFGVNTDQVEDKLEAVEKVDQATANDESIPTVTVDHRTMTITQDSVPKTEVVDQETMTIAEMVPKTEVVDQETMTIIEVVPKIEVIPAAAEFSAAAASSDAECQTETGGSDSTVDSTASDDVIGDAVVECSRCKQREETFTRNVGVGVCSISDKVEKDDVRSKEFDRARVEAVKKLLTSEQKQPFIRGTPISRSARIERNKGDDLEYITNKNRASSETPQTPASTPSGENKDALKTKVVLKKEIPPPPSNLPDPVPARIPRPKISKYVAPSENAETPDEEEEAADRLTPLRSELRSLGRWPRSNAQGALFSIQDWQ